MSLVEIISLRKEYLVKKSPFVALESLDLSIPEKSLFGLLGANGAGKTTTLRILSTLLFPTSGTAKIAGIDLTQSPKRIREKIGYVSQQGGCIVNINSYENLILQSQLYGMNKTTAVNRAKELVDIFKLDEFASRPVSTYSGGQRRRLELAMGIVHKPPVIFLDEPTVGLDPLVREELWLEMKKIQEEGHTIIFTTHYLDEADYLCDRIAILEKGKLVEEGSPTQLKQLLNKDLITMTLSKATTKDMQFFLSKLSVIIPEKFIIQNEQKITFNTQNWTETLRLLLPLMETYCIPVSALTYGQASLNDVFFQEKQF